MGFFSQDCDGCGHPALSQHATDRINRWMQHVVVIRPNGIIYDGWYDGYGRLDVFDMIAGEPEWDPELDDNDLAYEGTPYANMVIGGYFGDDDPDGNINQLPSTVWHHACWTVCGEPREFTGDSRHSADQGYFFDPEDHAMPEPKTVADVVAGRKQGDPVRGVVQAKLVQALASGQVGPGKTWQEVVAE